MIKYWILGHVKDLKQGMYYAITSTDSLSNNSKLVCSQFNSCFASARDLCLPYSFHVSLWHGIIGSDNVFGQNDVHLDKADLFLFYIS